MGCGNVCDTQCLILCNLLYMEGKGEIIIYQTEDKRNQLEVRLEDDTVWINQGQMTELFNQTKQNISLHINNIFKEGELSQNSVVKDSLTTEVLGNSFSLNILLICKLMFCFV